jgi:hypothetical protein
MFIHSSIPTRAVIIMSIPDEEQPLLRQITEDDTKHDEVILDFEPLDPEDPRNWSDAFKWCIVLLLASMAFTVYVGDSQSSCYHDFVLSFSFFRCLHVLLNYPFRHLILHSSSNT